MTGSARSLSAWLRERSDAELGELLARRADLATPVPADITVLAARATVRVSVLRALEDLDAAALAVLDACVLAAEPTSLAALAAVVGADPADADLASACARLTGLALVWGDPAELHVIRTVREVLDRPAGLGRPLGECLGRHAHSQLTPLLEAHDLPASPDRETATGQLVRLFGDPSRLAAALTRLAPEGSQERELLGVLEAEGPLGSTTGALSAVRLGDAQSPVQRMLAAGLLVGVDTATVELPREVGLALRGERPLGRSVALRPPEVTGSPVAVPEADRTGGAAATTFLRMVTEVAEVWGHDPPTVLRAGGLGVRELRAVAKLLEVEEAQAALVVEVAYAAGLVDSSPGLDPSWLPTTGFDVWSRRPPHEQWSWLAEAWLTSGRAAVLVGYRDTRDKVLAALGPDIGRMGVAATRREVLDALATVAAGVSPHGVDLRARITWRGPRRAGRLRDLLVEATLAEAEWLGVTGRGALTGYARLLLVDDPTGSAEALRAHLPVPVAELLLQADLTAVAPGPLEPALAREVGLAADVESKGAATVYRFSPTSIRRALDAGRGADDLHALLARLGRGGVPQTLTYLIDDVARRHGQLRAGAASCYLRCDDPHLLAEVVATKRVAALGMRRIAPTVVVGPVGLTRVLEVLRSTGFAPAPEGPDGVVLVGGREPGRVPSRPRPSRTDPPALSGPQRARVVHELREGDRASLALRRAGGADGAGPPVARDRSAVATLALLAQAIRESGRVWLGYLDASGSGSERIVAPERLDGGYLTAYDERAEMTKTFAVHRITGVVPVES